MNSYNYSYNVLINRLEAFAAGHLLIKRFTHGQIDLADMDQDEQYPFMHVVPNNIRPVDGGMQFDFQIIFADIPRDKELKAEYQREVISDCVRLAQDLIAEVKNGLTLFGFDVQLVTPPTIEPFMEEYKNTLTGVTFSLQLEVPWDWSACDIPAVWTVGGSSTGGSGTGIGLTLRTNGVDNAVQNILDLVEGTNVTITDNGDGSVTIDAAGGGGGEFVSTEFNANHATALGNQYVIGDRVWYNGSVYRCIANNDAINPSNPSYWTLVSVGYRLRQTPVDWNASTGDYQILNKPTLAAVATSGDYNDLINQPTIPVKLNDLDDVETTGVTNGQVLTYNSITALWEPETPAVGGTVTSVGLTMPNAFSVSGSPVTSAGTLAVTAVGTNSQYITGAGELANFPTLPPTVGDMLKSVYDLQDIGVVESAHKELVSVINKTGATVTKGQIVYLKTSSASATHPEIVLATATTEVGSSKTIGAIWQDIANDAVGFVVTSGEVSNLDTSAYNIGDRLWLGTTAGSVTTTPPAEPNHTVFIGTVTRSQNVNGRVLYAIQNGYELNELHGVLVTSEANRQGLFYNSTSGLWQNRLIEVADLPSAIDATKIGTGSVDNTEFSYLNGVTGAIQTQLDAKKDTFTTRSGLGPAGPADNTTYFFSEAALGLSTVATLYDSTLPFACRLIGAHIVASNNAGNATSELSTLNFRFNNTTDVLLSSAISFGGTQPISNTYAVTGLNQTLNAGDTYVLKWTTPTWATNPTGAQLIVTLYFERI